MAALEVSELTVEVASRIVVRDVSFKVQSGELHVLLGPNGSGKTTIINAIMGVPGYRVVKGSIKLDGVDITGRPVDERARLGIGVMFQRPPSIKGVKLGELATRIAQIHGSKLPSVDLNISSLLSRDLNVGFSGGEAKRSELYLLLSQRPKIALLDEPDSGVDVENLALIGKAISSLLEAGAGVLIVTHLGYIMRHIPTRTKAYVLIDGRIACRGDPETVLNDILEMGFDWCRECETPLANS